MKFETVIGLEVHVELATASKMFCGCSTSSGAAANSQVCPICLGMPGVLPVVNQEAVQLALKTAVAFHCQIAAVCRFARKSYFYPDLPKNYQISQYEEPLATGGWLEISGQRIRIRRIHLEEDAGKLIHPEQDQTYSLIDFNRTGIPLMEIVTEPDLRSPEAAVEFLQRLRQNLRYLRVSDCSMEEGSLRCDANISVRREGQPGLGVKVEVKNLNSFKSVRKALLFEASRQTRLLIEGKPFRQETRLWNENLGITESMRGKEQAHDYRYFPEPDLVPLRFEAGVTASLKTEVVELPQARRERLIKDYGLSSYEAEVLTAEKEVADYFEEAVRYYPQPRMVANWIMGDLAGLLREKKCAINQQPVTAEMLGELARMVHDGKITMTAAKDVLRETFNTGKHPALVVQERNLVQIDDASAVKTVVDQVIAENPKAWADFLAGTDKAIGFLIGQVMRKTRGRANPRKVEELIRGYRHGK
ncbi:MAG TPA: Asp-tRNA(Asn)/Glu-tRNA(Gln) amidotransferase subunit GatB [bacterium]|nr:Asp-tRNA(Asn)/Glu-tRNA(Gln) amidotransferase subunit GatB [bacterium]